ncbi:MULTISPECIES: hypothetical protein [Paraburkholderia]|uniref:hypothetical protein n=1 Tax=Paraburkholderia TaxID=1822464 RepID=UPI0017B67EF3|nr:hypothetical protein [Paraburkholderia tropica]MBB3002063.1 hypothetical protein [Paraburkholderia tropica]MDE1138565.1 hypothetical protein [Paraburkholderia tropica]
MVIATHNHATATVTLVDATDDTSNTTTTYSTATAIFSGAKASTMNTPSPTIKASA